MGRIAELVPYHERYLSFVYEMFTAPDHDLWVDRRGMQTLSQFEERFREDLKHFYHTFFVIVHADDADTPAGIFYTDRYRSADGTAFVTIAMAEGEKMTGIAAEAALLAYGYLFETWPLRKIYADVYDDNRPCLEFCRAGGFEEEGLMRDYSVHRGAWHGMHILALTRETAEKTIGRFRAAEKRGGE